MLALRNLALSMEYGHEVMGFASDVSTSFFFLFGVASGFIPLCLNSVYGDD